MLCVERHIINKISTNMNKSKSFAVLAIVLGPMVIIGSFIGFGFSVQYTIRTKEMNCTIDTCTVTTSTCHNNKFNYPCYTSEANYTCQYLGQQYTYDKRPIVNNSIVQIANGTCEELLSTQDTVTCYFNDKDIQNTLTADQVRQVTSAFFFLECSCLLIVGALITVFGFVEMCNCERKYFRNRQYKPLYNEMDNMATIS